MYKIIILKIKITTITVFENIINKLLFGILVFTFNKDCIYSNLNYVIKYKF